MHSLQSFLRSVFWMGAIAGAIGVLLYLFVLDTWVVPADDPMLAVSVEPTLRAGDRILIRRGGVPSSGQLARCLSPLSSSPQYVIGRVFGVPGDSIEIRNETVVVGGKPIVARHACPPVTLIHPVTAREVTLNCSVEDNGAWTYQALSDRAFPEGMGAARIEPGKAFLVSDNRHLHQDSRDFGLVDASTCEHVVYRLWGDTYADGTRRYTILW